MENTPVEEIDLLITRYQRASCYHSLPAGMRASDGYSQLVAIGRKAVPALLTKLQDEPSMSLMLLLSEITGACPDYKPEIEGGFAKFDVQDYAKAWIAWGKETDFLPK